MLLTCCNFLSLVRSFIISCFQNQILTALFFVSFRGLRTWLMLRHTGSGLFLVILFALMNYSVLLVLTLPWYIQSNLYVHHCKKPFFFCIETFTNSRWLKCPVNITKSDFIGSIIVITLYIIIYSTCGAKILIDLESFTNC